MAEDAGKYRTGRRWKTSKDTETGDTEVENAGRHRETLEGITAADIGKHRKTSDRKKSERKTVLLNNIYTGYELRIPAADLKNGSDRP